MLPPFVAVPDSSSHATSNTAAHNRHYEVYCAATTRVSKEITKNSIRHYQPGKTPWSPPPSSPQLITKHPPQNHLPIAIALHPKSSTQPIPPTPILILIKDLKRILQHRIHHPRLIARVRNGARMRTQHGRRKAQGEVRRAHAVSAGPLGDAV